MRSQSFLRKSHSLFKQSAFVHTSQTFPRSSSCCLYHIPPTKNVRLPCRFQSTSASPPRESEENDAPVASVASKSSTAVEESDVIPPRMRRIRSNSSSSSSTTKEAESSEFPPGLENDILYLPAGSLLDSRPSGLPPPEIFEEALNNLLITLHPQNQHRAAHPSSGSTRPVEPTLGLYCPIEGGDYIVDLTIHELAYQTGADVLILDAVQLSAGEWGPFGKAATALHLPNNPLHFPSPSQSSSESTRSESSDEDLEEGPQGLSFASTGGILLPAFKSLSQGRGVITTTARKASPTKLDAFFELLVNLTLPIQEKGEKRPTTPVKSRPRIIYIRDFPTLAPSSSIWYPPLLAAVRQRRRGLLTRPPNPNSSPVTIIFGMTPSITPPVNESSSGPGVGIMNLLMNRSPSSAQIAPSPKPDVLADWDEGEAADIAREKRLRSRLRKWEKSTSALRSEFPKLSLKDSSENHSSNTNIIVIGGPESSSPSSLGFGSADSIGQSESDFFRSSVVIPRSRSIPNERETRIARRREINELTMRMGVGMVGGVIEDTRASEALTQPSPASEKLSAALASAKSPIKPLWEDWGNKVEVWSNVCKIADRAIGSVMVSNQSLMKLREKEILEPTTTVPWSAVQTAWTSYHTLIDARKSWLKEAIGHPPTPEETTDEKESLNNAGSSTDKVVENIKNDPDLDTHEARLLPCIVDSGSIKTTFNQVHLPGHTIDAVRTIVSLPLLHPHAFQQGILKEHSMTGCLLFGPPGTGKTLVVRALAKEAGCRMLAISPSDVMDMYVGEGEKLVRAVFSLARKLSPCVVFLDEIDALFGARVSARESGSAHAHRGVITEFMQEMDGLKSSNDDNIIVIGATNRPFDLDDAVLRRLPRRLLVDLPGEKERAAIFKILLRDESLAEDVNIQHLAQKTEGFSGSDLKHLCVSAALDSVKQNAILPWSSRHAPEALSAPILVPVAQPAEPIASSPSLVTADIIRFTPEDQKVISAEEVPSVDASSSESAEVVDEPAKVRILQLSNFTQALKEITPSSSEALGSLADLRKWNEEFGEGRRDRKKYQVWGKGRFGFIKSNKDVLEEGRVAAEGQSTP